MTIPTTILDQHIAVLGKTGSGKTYAAKGLIESLLTSRRQVCVIDPTSAWWGLRLDRAGKPNGLNIVVLGGDRGDLPLSSSSGEAVARLVTEQRPAGVVLDTSGMTVGEYTRWFTDFAGAIYRSIQSPLNLVIDEAHQFMPQGKVPDPQAGKMLHADNRLMSGGRSRGIRGMLITQRPAKLHKDSLTCADALMAMRVIAPQDRKAIAEWIDGCGDAKQGRAVLDSLAQLERGEGWVWYPEGGYLERTKFPGIKTYDSSATPEHGKHAPATLGEIDLSAVQQALADAVAEAEANDPKRLRAQIADLQRQLAQREPVVDRAAIQAAEHRGRQAATAGIRPLIEMLGDHSAHLREMVRENSESADSLDASLRALDAMLDQPAALPRNDNFKTSLKPCHQPRQAEVGSVRANLPKGERAILIACAQHPGGCSREQLSILTAYKRSSRDAYIQRLRERGMVDTSGNTVTATDSGIDALGTDYEPLPTGAALRRYWIERLPEGERRVLEIVLEKYPNPVQRDAVDEATGYKRSSRDAYLQRLSARKLVQSVGRGEVIASEILF